MLTVDVGGIGRNEMAIRKLRVACGPQKAKL